jgi:hypothetical protein
MVDTIQKGSITINEFVSENESGAIFSAKDNLGPRTHTIKKTLLTNGMT